MVTADNMNNNSQKKLSISDLWVHFWHYVMLSAVVSSTTVCCGFVYYCLLRFRLLLSVVVSSTTVCCFRWMLGWPSASMGLRVKIAENVCSTRMAWSLFCGCCDCSNWTYEQATNNPSVTQSSRHSFTGSVDDLGSVLLLVEDNVRFKCYL